MVGTIFLLDIGEPVDGDRVHVAQVVVDALYLGIDLLDNLVGLVFVELQDALHLDLEQTQDVVAGNLAHKVFLEGFEALVNMFDDGIERLGVLEFLVFVDSFLNEDALQ